MPRLDSSWTIAALNRLRTTRSAIFGADSHNFGLNPRLSEADAQAFEQDHHIVLPSDYRQFLTDIGNGGAGPFYGLFPLATMDDGMSFRQWKENDGLVGVVSQSFLITQEWNDLTGMPGPELANQNESEYEEQMELFEKKYWSATLLNGAIPICHEGCALRIWLVVSGDQSGYLWEDRRSEYGGLRRLRLSDGSPASFARWYEEWLNECLQALDG